MVGNCRAEDIVRGELLEVDVVDTNNNNSYYNQSSDPPAVTGMMAPAPAQPQPLLEPGLRSSLADDVIRPKPDEAVSPGHRHIDSRQAIHPIDRRSAGESSSSSPSSERERR